MIPVASHNLETLFTSPEGSTKYTRPSSQGNNQPNIHHIHRCMHTRLNTCDIQFENNIFQLVCIESHTHTLLVAKARTVSTAVVVQVFAMKIDCQSLLNMLSPALHRTLSSLLTSSSRKGVQRRMPHRWHRTVVAKNHLGGSQTWRPRVLEDVLEFMRATSVSHGTKYFVIFSSASVELVPDLLPSRVPQVVAGYGRHPAVEACGRCLPRFNRASGSRQRAFAHLGI